MVPQIDFNTLNLNHSLIIRYEKLCEFPKEAQLCPVKLMYFTVRVMIETKTYKSAKPGNTRNAKYREVYFG